MKKNDEIIPQNQGIDLPLPSNDESTEEVQTTLSSDKVDNVEEELEKKARLYDKIDKHVYKRYAFKLLIGCGLTYLFLVIFDTVVSNVFSWNTSDMLDRFIELLKFVISTLIGYVFSESQKNKNE